MTRRKQVYKITYPNGKIYVGMDLTGSLLYLGSPSAHKRIAADLELDPRRVDLTLRKEILWECETASDAEVRKKELELIRETGANNPEIGYNVLPRWRGGRCPQPLHREGRPWLGTHAVPWTRCTDSCRAGAVTQVPSESSHRTRSIAAMTAGSSGSSP
jgi:hypothetical protein